MTRLNYWFLLGLFAVILLTGFVVYYFLEPAPTIQGKEFYAYLESTSKTKAVEDFAKITPAPIQFLGAATVARSFERSSGYSTLFRYLPKAIRRRFPSPMRSIAMEQNTYHVLGAYGPAARDALPTVLKTIASGQPYSKLAAMNAALTINHNSPEVGKAFSSLMKDPFTYYPAAMAIWITGLSPPGIESSLLPLKWNDPANPPFNGLLAVEVLGPAAASEIPAILRALEDMEAWGKAEGNLIRSLSRMGSIASNAIPILRERLEPGYNKSHQVAALLALRNIGPNVKQPTAVIASLLNDDDPTVRCAAAAAIGRLTGPTEACVTVLTEIIETKTDSATSWPSQPGGYGLQGGGFNTTQAAAWVLGELAPSPTLANAMPIINEELANNPRPWLAGLLSKVIWRQQRNASLVLVTLSQVLEGETTPQSRILACEVLAEMGDEAKTALPALRRATLIDLHTRLAALEAVKAIKTN